MFPNHSIDLALGNAVYRVQFHAPGEVFMVRRAVPCGERGPGWDRADPDKAIMDTEIMWCASRGNMDGTTSAVVLRAGDIASAHGWPRRLSLAF